MEKILFVNACVRKESRTLFLARQLLDRLQGGKSGYRGCRRFCYFEGSRKKHD
ncbi:MAG: hypothetical protein PUG54_10105 [Firmicutes bacterium]|nr:hypothetical protein [Bacillota bacterium]